MATNGLRGAGRVPGRVTGRVTGREAGRGRGGLAVGPGSWPVVALAVVLLGLLSALVGAAGPAELGTPRLGAIDGADDRRGAGEPAAGPTQDRPAPEEETELPGWLLVAAWTLGLCLVGCLVVRSLRRADPAAEPHDEEPVQGRDDGGAAVSPGSRLRDAARRAAVDLRHPQGGVADLVVQSWERLEDTAAGIGETRPSHVTTTEFTTALLARTGADAASTATLLHLYHRARFSGAPLPADAGPRAVAALEAIAASIASDDRVHLPTP